VRAALDKEDAEGFNTDRIADPVPDDSIEQQSDNDLHQCEASDVNKSDLEEEKQKRHSRNKKKSHPEFIDGNEVDETTDDGIESALSTVAGKDTESMKNPKPYDWSKPGIHMTKASVKQMPTNIINEGHDPDIVIVNSSTSIQSTLSAEGLNDSETMDLSPINSQSPSANTSVSMSQVLEHVTSDGDIPLTGREQRQFNKYVYQRLDTIEKTCNTAVEKIDNLTRMVKDHRPVIIRRQGGDSGVRDELLLQTTSNWIQSCHAPPLNTTVSMQRWTRAPKGTAW
jgi:hypothetical protein